MTKRQPQTLREFLDSSWVEDPNEPGIYRMVEKSHSLKNMLKATVKRDSH